MVFYDVALEYGLFLLKTLTILFAILMIIGTAKGNKKPHKSEVNFKTLNDEKEKLLITHTKTIYEKKERRKKLKEIKCKLKERNKSSYMFVLEFKGDIKASQVDNLRKEITAILALAKPTDRVLLILESPGGCVSPYGLAASQLARFKEHNIPLTVAIDRVAASGGYLMAAVADHILAAPFAMVGSIGVIMQLPNFNQLLKKHNIEFEQHTSTQFKRTLTMLGRNTDEGRQKAIEQIEDIHQLFTDHIKTFRDKVDLSKVATGEVWLGHQAIKLNLVDKLQTSDDYLMQAFNTHNVIGVSTPSHAGKLQKLLKQSQTAIGEYFTTSQLPL